MLNKKALSAAVQAAAGDVYVEDVFSTDLYSGNSSLQTITNGIDLSTNGGMVWVKVRSLGDQHALFDSARGLSKSLATNLTSAQYDWSGGGIDQFNSDGFRLDGNNSQFNDSTYIYASWTFRKAAKFFDVVTYTGNGVAGKTVSHNLGSVPGCIIIKRTDVNGNDWAVWHRSQSTSGARLNNTAAFDALWYSEYFGSTQPTSTVFTIGDNGSVNSNGKTYVAYLFAHDAGGFGTSGSDNVITCGSYTGDGLNPGPTITLNWEPQWFLVKNASNTGNWQIYDNVRGLTMESNNDWVLNPNLSNAESGSSRLIILPTGIQINTNSTELNTSGETYIYIAIRRGPMKTPTDATKVFTPTVYTGTNVDNRLIDTTIAPDFVMIRQRDDTVITGMYTGARITGNEYMLTGSNVAGATDADSFDAQVSASAEYGNAFSSMSGVWVGNDATRKFNANTTTDNHIIEAFKRAPGFMDVVCYTGTGANRTVTHNLGVSPEMMWVKARNTTGAWTIYHSANGNTKYARFNDSGVPATDSTMWNNTSPTSSTFALGTNSDVNQSTSTYIAVLFASCSGVSKIGSYTGNGTSQTINCGFTNGTRFVLIKRTDDTGDWPIFDSARGIVAAEDPYFLLNANTAEIAGLRDAVDSTSSGFIVNETTGPNINTNNATYIYIAIA